MDASTQPTVDPRIRNLSYSSLLTLHSCPRKYELYKKSSKVEESEDSIQSVTFAYGHTVGTGTQSVLEGKNIEQVVWDSFLAWECDLLEENTKQNKSFWLALIAVQKLSAMRQQGLLKDYEIVIFNGKPAVELSFEITFPDGFRYRGHVDAVLRNVNDGKVLVWEGKTSSMANINSAQYKNSAQAIGYSIVLDAIFPDLNSYEVLYSVYKSKAMEYEFLEFTKSYLQRALWIKELLLDIETIKMYEEAEIYPMRGESCYSWYRECEYLNLCTLSTQYLITQYDEERDTDKVDYQVRLTLNDLIESQLRK